MLDLIIFILASAGMTLIITKSRLFAFPRSLFDPSKLHGYFIQCPQCVGFWAGVIFTPALYGEWYNPDLYLTGFRFFGCGCIASFTSLWLAHFMDYTFFNAQAINFQLNGRPQPPRPMQPPPPPPQQQPENIPTPEPKKLEPRIIPTVDNPHGVKLN
ncbi:MAG: hypothetical protein LBP59_10340 [Planctomycetaceae bacterium]|jgi:hypothetical protein|nr:hypothetical protein [Planctomycetaceae bacterium]